MSDLPEAAPEAGSRIECQVSEPFTAWLAELPGTLAITTYQAGKLAFVGWRNNQPTLLMREFEKPMGLAVAPGQLALATRNEITFLANAPLLAPEFLIDQPNRYDALYLPRASYYTGDLNVHDVSFAGDDFWIV